METRRGDESVLVRQTESLDRTVNTLDAVMQGIRSESFQARARLNRMVNARCSTLAKLPPEILSMIFEAACTKNMERRFIPTRVLNLWRDRSAINLTCFHWREVALRTPSLWNNVVMCGRLEDSKDEFSDDSSWDSELESMVEDQMLVMPEISLMRVMLERAGEVPLNTHVYCNSRNGLVTDKYWSTILPYITRAIEMSRTLDITLHTLPQYFGILSKPSPLAKLRYFWLEWGESAWSASAEETIDLSQATSIITASISTRAFGFQRSDLPVLVHLRLPAQCTLRILSLKGRFFLADVISAVVCCADRLESLTLDVDATDATVRDTPFPTELRCSRLHHLGARGRFSTILMRTISAPRLWSLKIHSAGIDLDAGSWTQFPHPFPGTRQFPALTQLCTSFQAPVNVLMPFLMEHPTLKTVSPVDIALARRALLTDNSVPPTPILPNIRSLFINFSSLDANDISTLRQLAAHLKATRSSSTGPKCKLHLRGRSPALQRLAIEFPEQIRLLRREREADEDLRVLAEYL